MWFLLAGCGGPAELTQPHPPPTWPIENVYVRDAEATPEPVETPSEAPATEADPSAPASDADPDDTPEPTPAPEPTP